MIFTVMTAVRANRQGKRKTDNKANVYVIKSSQRLEKGGKNEAFFYCVQCNKCMW